MFHSDVLPKYLLSRNIMQKLLLLLSTFALECQDTAQTTLSASALITHLSQPRYRMPVKYALDNLQSSQSAQAQSLVGILKGLSKRHDQQLSSVQLKASYLQRKCNKLSSQLQSKPIISTSTMLTSLSVALASASAAVLTEFATKENLQTESMKPIATTALLVGAGFGSVAFVIKKVNDFLCTRTDKNKLETAKIKCLKCSDEIIKLQSHLPEDQATVDQALVTLKEMIQCIQGVPQAPAATDETALLPIATQPTADATQALRSDNTPAAELTNVKHTAEASCQVSEECFLSMHDINIGFGKAVQEGNILKIKMFIDLGANIDQEHAWHRNFRFDDLPARSTALCYAADQGYDAVVDLLLEHHANTETPYWGQTPLLIAARKNHTVCVEKLIQAGANINVVDWCHKSVLYFAALHKNVGLMNILLRAGIDVQATLKDFQSETYLGYGHDKEAIKTLIEERVALFLYE